MVFVALLYHLKIQKMEHNKIIKDERGKIRIEVRIVVFQYGQTDKEGNEFRYDVLVWHTAKGKRKEVLNKAIAKPHEIWDAKTKLWYLLKP